MAGYQETALLHIAAHVHRVGMKYLLGLIMTWLWKGLLRPSEAGQARQIIPVLSLKNGPSVCRGVAQPGSAPALGAGSRRFKSGRPDHIL